MGAIDAELDLVASHPPAHCPLTGSLRVNISALRAAADSPLLGFGGDVSGYSRSIYEREIAEAEVWNALVAAQLIVRGDDNQPRSGLSGLADIQDAARHEWFQQWFRFGHNQRRRELDAQQATETIVSIVLLVMDLLSLRAGTAGVRSGTAASVSPFRAWLRRQLAKLAPLLARVGRSPRATAQRLVAELIRQGKRVVVNIGGEASPNDIARWGDAALFAINLNSLMETRPQSGIPNLVRADAARIGELFDAGQVDEIISMRLPPDVLDWQTIIPGAHRTLKPGGRITINFQGVGSDAPLIVEAMRHARFRNIENLSGAVITAIK
jgi:hypothetical protein